MNQEDACPRCNPKWDPDSVLAIPNQSRQSPDTHLLLEINFRIKPNQPIWHPKMPWWISHLQSYDIQQGDDRTGIKNNPNYKHSPYWKCWEEAHWSALTGRESPLDISHQVYGENGQPMQLEMQRQVNSENNDMDTQTSDSKHTWTRSGKHTRRKADECTRQLEMTNAPSTGRMLSVCTNAPTWRMISATAWAPKRWWDDEVRLIYAERVQLCLPK